MPANNDDLFGDQTDDQPIVDRDVQPEYDAEALKVAFPEYARMDFAQNPNTGMIITKLVSNDLETVKEVDVGYELPPDTATMIEIVSGYLHAKVDSTIADEAEAALAEFDAKDG